MRRHQVWNKVLLLANPFGFLIKHRRKLSVDVDMRLTHAVENMVAAMFRRNLQLTGDMMCDQFLQKPVVLSGQHIVIPDTRTDKHLFDTGNLTDLPQHVQILRMVDLQRRTGGRCKAFFAALAKTCCQLFFTGRMAKISGWAADIMDIPFKSRQRCQQSGFFEDRFHTPYRNPSSLMESD